MIFPNFAGLSRDFNITPLATRPIYSLEAIGPPGRGGVSRMRICQLMIGRGFGGGERCFVDTAIALAHRGHTVQAICHHDFLNRTDLEAIPGITVSPVKVRGSWNLFASHRIARAIEGFRPDVVHTHMARGANLGGRAARRLGIPVVAALHNYVKLKYYREIDRFLCTTNDQQEYLKASGIDAARIDVVPNFSRMETRRERVAGSERSTGVTRLATVGRLHAVKGFDILLLAMKSLRDRGLRIELEIGGDGPERDGLRNLTRSLGLTDVVRFAGWVDDSRPLLDAAHLYVCSSRAESFGIALLEAMARRLPIVSTSCPGPRQLADDTTIWFAPPNDAQGLASAIAEAIRQPEERERRALQLQKIFEEKFSEASVVDRVVESYRRMGVADRTAGTRRNAA